VFQSGRVTSLDLELRRPYVDWSRTRGAFDDGRPVATCRSFATTMTVPGGAAVSTAALSNVTVLPTHRRRGLLTEMLTADLADCVERGEPVGALVAAEWPIYGRYGYGPAVERAAYEIDTRAAAFRRPADGGSVALVDPPSARADVVAVHDALRTRCPGSIERLPFVHDRAAGSLPDGASDRWQGELALHRDADGTVDGYVRWRSDAKWDGMRPCGTLHVDELFALTDDAYAALWRLVLGVDLVTTVRAENRPPVEPLRHLLTDGRAARQVRTEDVLWVRLLDVPVALSARRYPVADRVVLDVVDPGGWATGRYALDASPDGATCVRTTETAELSLPVQSLGAAYLGGTRLATLAAAGLVDEHAAGALARADALLGPLEQPWMLTGF
jgi:predicted acetyltransferase